MVVSYLTFLSRGYSHPEVETVEESVLIDLNTVKKGNPETANIIINEIV